MSTTKEAVVFNLLPAYAICTSFIVSSSTLQLAKYVCDCYVLLQAAAPAAAPARPSADAVAVFPKQQVGCRGELKALGALFDRKYGLLSVIVLLLATAEAIRVARRARMAHAKASVSSA